MPAGIPKRYSDKLRELGIELLPFYHGPAYPDFGDKPGTSMVAGTEQTLVLGWVGCPIWGLRLIHAESKVTMAEIKNQPRGQGGDGKYHLYRFNRDDGSVQVKLGSYRRQKDALAGFLIHEYNLAGAGL
jgi:hypothetical protein